MASKTCNPSLLGWEGGIARHDLPGHRILARWMEKCWGAIWNPPTAPDTLSKTSFLESRKDRWYFRPLVLQMEALRCLIDAIWCKDDATLCLKLTCHRTPPRATLSQEPLWAFRMDKLHCRSGMGIHGHCVNNNCSYGRVSLRREQ